MCIFTFPFGSCITTVSLPCVWKSPHTAHVRGKRWSHNFKSFITCTPVFAWEDHIHVVASVLSVPYNITVQWKMQVSGLITRLLIANPEYFVEEEPKGTSKCFRKFCGEIAVDSRTALQRASLFREGRISTAWDARNTVADHREKENRWRNLIRK